MSRHIHGYCRKHDTSQTKLVVFNHDRPIAEFFIDQWGMATFHDFEGCVAEWRARWDNSLESRKAIARICGFESYPFCKGASLKFRTMPMRDEHIERHKEMVATGHYRLHRMARPLTATIGELVG